MPVESEDELKTLIASGDVFAVSLDTAVFDGKQKNFLNTVLQKLDQFHKRDIRFVIVDVIAEEMKAHLRNEAAESQRALKKALRMHNNRWRRAAPENEGALLLLDADGTAFASNDFENFMTHVRGELIAASDAADAVDEVFKSYFSGQPPFGSADKRKSEFPDAFALLRLEALAAEEEGILLCVSPDRGWLEFAARSDRLVCISKLEDALALFNAADQDLAGAIVDVWKQDGRGDANEEVATGFEYILDDLDFDIDARTEVLFDAEPTGAVLQYIPASSIGKPVVIAVDAESLTFTVKVEALVDFEASFTFYVIDSIDRDEVRLGSEDASVQTTVPFDLTITADRSHANGPIFHEVEVAKKRLDIDFGYVEAFPGDDPTHEKY